jgi:ATPase subunit of ABC transporter with duplicated ATPase domains
MSSLLLDAQQITRRHGARTVLSAVDIRVADDARIGLIGPNGSGKSTLLRILAAIEPHAAALDHWLALGAADAETRLASAVTDLGLDPAVLDRKTRTLSGGQLARVGLAGIAVARFGVMLVDEPTSHLDEDGLRRLTDLIRARSGGIVLVSHDREFLADVVDEVVELDPHNGRATHFSGGWYAFERERAAGHARAIAAHERAVARRDQLIAAERETRRRAAASASRARSRVRDNDKAMREWVSMRADGMANRARKMGGRARRVEVPERPRGHADSARDVRTGRRDRRTDARHALAGRAHAGGADGDRA